MGSVIEIPVSSNLPLISWTEKAISSLTEQERTVRNIMMANGNSNSSYIRDGTEWRDYKMSNVVGMKQAYYIENGVYGIIGYHPANSIIYYLGTCNVSCEFLYTSFIDEGYTEYTAPSSTQFTFYNYFTSYQEAYNAIHGNKPIVYRDTNCSHNGPDSAVVGDTVTVHYTFPEGYGIVNPSSDIYVTNNGIVVPSSYANGMLTFTMPDPS